MAETITHLLNRWSEGQRAAAEKVMPRVYDELRRTAERLFRRERPDHTLGATALVHEVYLRLDDSENTIRWQSRAHFFGLSACLMRRILVEHGRRRAYLKNGGALRRTMLEEAHDATRARPAELLALDDALRDLERRDPTKALVVELRFFGGLSVDETGECLGLSPRTVARQWRRARALLYRELGAETADAL